MVASSPDVLVILDDTGDRFISVLPGCHGVRNHGVHGKTGKSARVDGVTSDYQLGLYHVLVNVVRIGASSDTSLVQERLSGWKRV